MKVLLCGYYGYANFGDEWSLAAVAAAIRQVEPASELRVISGQPDQTKALHGLAAVSRNPYHLYQALQWMDLLVCAGGSLLQDVTSARSLLFYLGLLTLAHRLGKPVVLWGQGIGPIIRPKLRTLTGKLLNQAALITVRDQASLDFLQELGVQRPPVVLAADPVFTGFQWQLEQISAAPPILTVVLRDWPGLKPEEWLPGLAQGVATVAQGLGCPVQLYGVQAQQDHLVLQRMEAICRDLGLIVEVQAGWQSLADVAQVLSGSGLVVAQRYHVLALAAQLGLPAVGLSYDPKVEALGRRLGLPVLSKVEVQDSRRVATVLHDAWLDSQPQRLNPVLQELRAAAYLSQKAFQEVVVERC